MLNWKELCRIKPNRTGMSNGGWAYDAYPELKTLDAFSRITVADIKGPGVITCIHTTQLLGVRNAVPVKSHSAKKKELRQRAERTRGVILEIYYNDMPEPAVRAPLGDFFADGCCGHAVCFGSRFVEKVPESYNCFIPMPFEGSARVELVNETENDYENYTFVEYEQLDEWDPGLGYFHATWDRFAFRLGADSRVPFLHIDGKGHLLGRSWSVCSDEPFFERFHFIMEANNEFRIDGEDKPRFDYLGTEDSFGFSWGFRSEYAGPYNGMNYIKHDPVSQLSLVSIYRFMENNPIRFNTSLDLTLNWTQEHTYVDDPIFREKLEEAHQRGGGFVDYATTYYWYQQKPGCKHKPLPPLEDRCRMLLKRNPR